MNLSIHRLGWVCFLYAFSHAYFGVAAIKTVQNGWSDLSPSVLFQFFSGGSAWAAMLLGSILMIFKRRSGLWIALSGFLFSGIQSAAGLADLLRNMPDFRVLLIAARPPADLFMVALLAVGGRLKRNDAQGPLACKSKKWKRKAIILSGSSLPWLVWVFLRLKTAPASMPAPFIAVFMTFWYGIPFICLALLMDLSDVSGNWLVWGGMAGAALATVVVSIMMWGDRFDSFLMPISAPLRFASAGAGMMIGLLARAPFRKR